jgi:hypothetical protein
MFGAMAGARGSDYHEATLHRQLVLVSARDGGSGEIGADFYLSVWLLDDSLRKSLILLAMYAFTALHRHNDSISWLKCKSVRRKTMNRKLFVPLVVFLLAASAGLVACDPCPECPECIECPSYPAASCIDFQAQAPQTFPGPDFAVGPLLITNPLDSSGTPLELGIADRGEDTDGLPELYVGYSDNASGWTPMRVTFLPAWFPDGAEAVSVTLRHFNSAEVIALADDGSQLDAASVSSQDVRTTLVVEGGGTPIRELEWVMVETLVYEVCWGAEAVAGQDEPTDEPSAVHITFDAFPDGTQITEDLVLEGDEFLDQGIRLAGAPEPSDTPYCADATATAILHSAYDLPVFLTTARPGKVTECNTVPLAITFTSPARKVTLTFAGASTTYTLQAYDSTGALLGTEQRDAVSGSGTFEVTFSSDDANIDRVVFGHTPVLPEPALTAITGILYER